MQNYYQFLTELIIAVFAGTLLVQLIPNTEADWETTSTTCMNLIIAIFILNIAVSLCTLISQISTKIREFIKKRRSRTTGIAYEIKTTPETGGDDKNID